MQKPERDSPYYPPPPKLEPPSSSVRPHDTPKASPASLREDLRQDLLTIDITLPPGKPKRKSPPVLANARQKSPSPQDPHRFRPPARVPLPPRPKPVFKPSKPLRRRPPPTITLHSDDELEPRSAPRDKGSALMDKDTLQHRSQSIRDKADADLEIPLNEGPWNNPFDLSESQINGILEPAQAMPIQFTDLVNTPALNPLRLRLRAELQALFTEKLDMSLTELIKFVYEQELACTTLQGTDCEFVLSEAYITLLAFDRRILDGLINGNLPALYAQAGSEEAMIEERLRDRASTSGHIAYYMNTIMDKNNRSVVWRHLNAVVGDVLLYMQQDSASSCIRSFLVDQEFSQKVRQIGHYREGFRKFLYDKDDPHSGHFVPRREQACVAFAKYLRIALDSVPITERDDPFRDFLVYFGITGRLDERFEEHEDDAGSNYIMHLILSCLQRRWPNMYRIKQYVVALCVQPEGATLGEILVTRLGQGYITSGVGFSHYPAGRSVPGSNRTVGEWNDDFAWIEENTTWDENHQAELERLRNPPKRKVVLDRDIPIHRVLMGLVKYATEQWSETGLEGMVAEKQVPETQFD